MYANGQIPNNLLLTRPSAGKDPCLMMPGTALKHDRLVTLGAPYGWVPLVSGPDDAYRSLAVQRYYVQTMPAGQAAAAGTSSHGGTFDFGDGRGPIDQGAVDYGNWAEIGWEKFCELTRAAGFIPGVFVGRPGIPDEYWHVFDPTPWDTTAPAIDLALMRRKAEDGMYIKGTSFPDIYKTGEVWNSDYPKGQVVLRACTPFEAQCAIVGGLVITVDDATLTNLAKMSGYGGPLATPTDDAIVKGIADIKAQLPKA